MQTTLLGLAILIIVALVSALVAPLVVDWNQYRSTFEQEASRLAGFTVHVRGPIDARILPAPRLEYPVAREATTPVCSVRLRNIAKSYGDHGVVRDLSPNSLVLLKLLASAPGAVVSRDVMLEALGGDDPHVVEAAVARLRSAIGAKELIATAVKRGYRLAVDFMPDDTGSPQ